MQILAPALKANMAKTTHCLTCSKKRSPVLGRNFKVVPDIGGKIKTAREECGLSQIELARELGYQSSTALSLIESNQRHVTALTVWKISQITKLPTEHFIRT